MKRPRLRCDCPPRPCPFVSCRYHLFLDVGANGAITTTRDEPLQGETCALDVAERKGLPIRELAAILGRSVGSTHAELQAAVTRFTELLDVRYDVSLIGPVVGREGYESLGDGGFQRVPVRYD